MVRPFGRDDVREQVPRKGGMSLDQLAELVALARSRGIPGSARPRVLRNFGGRIYTFEVGRADVPDGGPDVPGGQDAGSAGG